MPKLNDKVKQRFGYENMPNLDELEQMAKLLLVNSDDSIDYHEPMQPNMIQVGGLQITPPKNLTAELKAFVESSSKGTVLMSLGTNIKSNSLGNERLTEIISTFAELPEYNFVWKFESEAKDLPIPITKNVFISKFLPQNDILAHPNVEAFITHSGGLSTQESLWYGKPMIAIPFIVDQKRSASKSVFLGVAVQLDFRTLNKRQLKSAILEILRNPKYTRNAKKISRDFQDKPQSSLDKAIWHIERVMRNPDSPKYKPITLQVGYLIANSFDVILILLVAFATLIFLAFKSFRAARYFLGSRNDKKMKRNWKSTWE